METQLFTCNLSKHKIIKNDELMREKGGPHNRKMPLN